jgi:uncharacterized protein YjbI with pentapeptide repeats
VTRPPLLHSDGLVELGFGEQDSVVPARKSARMFTPPLPPEPPSEAQPRDDVALFSHDECEDEVAIDVDLAGHAAEGVRLTRCELHRVVLTGAQFRGLSLVDVLAVDCELSGAYMLEAHLQRVEMRNCRMTGVVLGQATLSHVSFRDCKLDDASFRLLRADHVEMNGCSLLQADFYEASLTNSALDDCDLRGGDLSKASVRGVRFGGTKLDGVRGALNLAGAVIAGDQVLPLALSLFAELHIEIENEER